MVPACSTNPWEAKASQIRTDKHLCVDKLLRHSYSRIYKCYIKKLYLFFILFFFQKIMKWLFVLLIEVDSSQLRRQLCGGSQAAIERMIHFGRELQAMSEQLRRECGKNTANKKMLKVRMLLAFCDNISGSRGCLACCFRGSNLFLLCLHCSWVCAETAPHLRELNRAELTGKGWGRNKRHPSQASPQ